MSRPRVRQVLTVLCTVGLAAAVGATPAAAVHARAGGHRAGSSTRRDASNGRIWFREGYVGELGSVDPAGGTPALTARGADNPALDATGTRVVAELHGLSILNADGTGVRPLTDDGIDPDWSPTGSQVVFALQDDIWKINADGTGLTQLTDTPEGEADPAWSPDGHSIAYTAEGCNQTGGGSCVYVMANDGSDQHNLTPEEAFDCGGGPTALDVTAGRPAWSPDGTKIAFREFAGCSANSEGTDIWSMNADGSGKVDLTPDSGTGDDYPTWSPDGSTIAFLSDRGHDDGQNYLFEVPATGGTPTEVPIAFEHATDHPSDIDWAQPVPTVSTEVSLKAADARLARPGKEKFKLRMLPIGGDPYAGQKLTLQEKGKHGWSDVAQGTAKTDDAGKAVLTTKVDDTTTYRAVYAANPVLGLLAGKSAPVTVKVG